MSNPAPATDIRFSSPDGLPADYKDLLIRMLSIQSRIESEYMLAPERTLIKPLALAPTAEDKAEYAAFWSDEVRHASYWMKLLEDLGVTVDAKFMASPMPIYIFEMRDQAEDWLEYGLFSFFADRQGAYMGYEWVGCSYEPLARIAERVHKEELGHAAFGYRLIRRYLQREGDRWTGTPEKASGKVVPRRTRYVRKIRIQAAVRLRPMGLAAPQQRADAR